VKPIKVNYDRFDLDRFVGEIMDWFSDGVVETVEPTAMVPWVVKGRAHYGKEDEPRDLIAELTVEGKTLMLPFSSSNCGDPIRCADGCAYEFEDADDEDEWDDSDEEQAETDESSLYFGETDSLGYLVSLEGSDIVIRSGVLSFGLMCFLAPSADEVLDCGVFDQPMYDFVNKFIKR
jgi:hypothetical protein